MSKIQKLSIPLFIAICSFGYGEDTDEPTVEYLITALESTLPSFIKVDHLQLDVSESIGTKVKPVVRSRFKGRLFVIEDIYMESSLISNKMVLRKIYDKESEFNLSGTSI